MRKKSWTILHDNRSQFTRMAAAIAWTRRVFSSQNHIYWENYASNSFQIEWDMIMVTVFLSILNQMEFYLVQNRKENYHQYHIPFYMKGNGILVFSVHQKGKGPSEEIVHQVYEKVTSIGRLNIYERTSTFWADDVKYMTFLTSEAILWR